MSDNPVCKVDRNGRSGEQNQEACRNYLEQCATSDKRIPNYAEHDKQGEQADAPQIHRDGMTEDPATQMYVSGRVVVQSSLELRSACVQEVESDVGGAGGVFYCLGRVPYPFG